MKARWRREHPGCYRLMLGERSIGLVERSIFWPYMWWWNAFAGRLDVAGLVGSLRLAKQRTIDAHVDVVRSST